MQVKQSESQRSWHFVVGDRPRGRASVRTLSDARRFGEFLQAGPIVDQIRWHHPSLVSATFGAIGLKDCDLHRRRPLRWFPAFRNELLIFEAAFQIQSFESPKSARALHHVQQRQ